MAQIILKSLDHVDRQKSVVNPCPKCGGVPSLAKKPKRSVCRNGECMAHSYWCCGKATIFYIDQPTARRAWNKGKVRELTYEEAKEYSKQQEEEK